MANKIIFHYPGALFSETDTGEKKRPTKILEAFKLLNYEVTILAGSYSERVELFQKIKNDISQFDFVYSENSNLPLATTGNSRFPHFKSIDYQLFNLAKETNIPIGVFIRDVFWKVKDTANAKAIHKRIIGKILFDHEVKHYYQNCSAIFIPTESCKKYLPVSDFKNFQLLPPGAEIVNFQKQDPKEIKKLVYVGSCNPPVYQVIKGFQKILACPNIHLTIVTRAGEHEILNKALGSHSKNLSILSASDQALSEILQKQDIGLACIDQNEYWDLAMPIKIFDYIGHQLPVLTYKNGETAKLIQTNQLGWVLEEAKELQSFLQNITADEIKQKSKPVKEYLSQNSWQDRAKTISKILQNK